MSARREVASCSGTAITNSVSAARTSAGTHDRRYPRNDEQNTSAGTSRPARSLTLPNMALIIVDQPERSTDRLRSDQSGPTVQPLRRRRTHGARASLSAQAYGRRERPP